MLVAKANKIVYKRRLGKANLELNCVALKPNHVFRIGSVTKQFTACAILKLAEEGKLSLQDDITKFIRDYPVATYYHRTTAYPHLGNKYRCRRMDAETRKRDFTPQALIDSH